MPYGEHFSRKDYRTNNKTLEVGRTPSKTSRQQMDTYNNGMDNKNIPGVGEDRVDVGWMRSEDPKVSHG